MTAVTGSNRVIALLYGIGEEALRNIQILNVIDLVPDLSAQPLGFDLLCLKQCNELDYGFIVFVVAHGLRIRLEEGNIRFCRKMLTEFIDVYSLIVAAFVFKF